MNKLSNIILDQLPEFVKADHPTFIAFLEAYYEFCEQTGGSTYTGRNNWDDIDHTLPEFLDYFYKDFLPLFPEEILGDKTLLVKHAKEFYRSKGSEKSFKLLFRVLFNEDVDFYYPKKDILKVSAGKWSILNSLRIFPDDVSTVLLFKNLVVVGQTTDATAQVDDVRKYSQYGETIYELFLSSVSGEFSSSERIEATYTYPDGTKLVLGGSTLGILTGINIIARGADNNVGDNIPIIGGGGTGAAAVVSAVTSGSLVNINVIHSGVAYRGGDQIKFTNYPGDLGTGAAAYIESVEDIKQHPTNYYLNSDVIGAFDNLTFASTTFASNISGKVSVSAGSIVVRGSNTFFLSELGDNVALKIGTTTRLVANVVNNTYLTVNSSYSGSDLISQNGVVATALASSNENTAIFDAFTYNILYGPTGPIKKIKITNQGTNYKKRPTINVAAYIPAKNQGIIGEVQIVNAGTNYQVGDELTFTTVAGYGRGAAGRVSTVGSSGEITGIVLDYPKLTGWGDLSANSSNVLMGNGTLFTTELHVGDRIIIQNEEKRVNAIANDIWLTTNSAFSFSTSNVRVGKKTEFIGGIQYNTSEVMPNVNVGSVAGSNASLRVSSLVANGEILIANTIAGEILAVQITNPGVNYTSNVHIDMTHNGDGSAILTGDIVSGSYKYPGRYIDDSNLLNSASRLQDRDYYQNYSYVLKSRVSFNKYINVVKSLIHPIGMKVFAETNIDSSQIINRGAEFSITMDNITLWFIVDSDYVAHVYDHINVETINGPITITLPTNRRHGDRIYFNDSTNTWAINNLTIIPSSSSTVAGSDMLVADLPAQFILIYDQFTDDWYIRDYT